MQMKTKPMDVARYDERARGWDAPIYAYYARKIHTCTGISHGLCLDVGCGGGYLGLALAGLTGLHFILLDNSVPMLEKADLHIIEDGLQDRARTLLADVHRMPLEDDSIDLIISRGSFAFWKDPALAVRELYRVLAPGGQAFVGRGRGTAALREQIDADMRAQGIDPSQHGRPRLGSSNQILQHDFNTILQTSGIPRFTIDNNEDGVWIQLWKEPKETN